MDTTARRRRTQKQHQVIYNINNFYNHDVSMFSIPPNGAIPLREFEDLALERLQLFRIIEQATIKNHKPFSDGWKKCVKEDLVKLQLKKYVRLMNGFGSQTDQDYEARRSDHLSHYILRLAYCRSEDLRRWFLSREIEWFKLKFLVQKRDEILRFLQLNSLTYIPISTQEKDDIRDELISSTSGPAGFQCDLNNFYKIPFAEVCSLVKNRRVFLQNGFAFVPESELIVCIQSQFRANLSEALNIANHRLPLLDDDRLNSLLSNLHHIYTGKDYNNENEKEKERIYPQDLDGLTKKHFPLCMRSLHEVLRSTHHLKHWSRLQYGLFLKGIGLLYDDAMQFWQDEFTKCMDLDKFTKGYEYNFKHQYGKVGKMVNYSPYSCMKIIMNNVGPGEHHGCPFKHWDAPILKAKLEEHGIGSDGVQEIQDLVTNHHYQIACTKYFECVHQGQAPTNTITHPNQYFEESTTISKK